MRQALYERGKEVERQSPALKNPQYQEETKMDHEWPYFLAGFRVQGQGERGPGRKALKLE